MEDSEQIQAALTKAGNKVLSKFESEYGPKGKSIFYAARNKGVLSSKLTKKKRAKRTRRAG